MSGTAALRASSSSWVPCSTTRPWSMTTIRSARCRVERRWATSSVVRPAMTPRRASWIASSILASTALVASSRIRMRGSYEDGPGQGDALALATREGQASLPDDGVVPPRGALDELVGFGGPRRRLDLLVGGVRAAVGDVGPHRVGEEEALLEHDADLADAASAE